MRSTLSVSVMVCQCYDAANATVTGNGGRQVGMPVLELVPLPVPAAGVPD